MLQLLLSFLYEPCYVLYCIPIHHIEKLDQSWAQVALDKGSSILDRKKTLLFLHYSIIDNVSITKISSISPLLWSWYLLMWWLGSLSVIYHQNHPHNCPRKESKKMIFSSIVSWLLFVVACLLIFHTNWKLISIRYQKLLFAFR